MLVPVDVGIHDVEAANKLARLARRTTTMEYGRSNGDARRVCQRLEA